MPAAGSTPSARRTELLEACYRYALAHGLTDLSLRPLAAAVGSSPRVLLFLFGSKEGLVRELLARARADEEASLAALRARIPGPVGLREAATEVWAWLSADEHRPLLALWVEGYARSLIDRTGPWSGFAAGTVEDWLALLAAADPSGPHAPAAPTRPTLSRPTPSQPTPSQPTLSQPTPSQPTPSQPTPSQPTLSQPTLSQPTLSQSTPSQPTLTLAVLRGALLDLLATGDVARTTAAVHHHLATLGPKARRGDGRSARVTATPQPPRRRSS